MIYFIVLIVLVLFAILYDVLNLREARNLSYWLSCFLLICLAGFRYKVGGDTYNYMYAHEFLPDLTNLFSTEIDSTKLQPLWVLFTAVSKSIGEDFYILQLFHALLINGVIFYFILNNTVYRHTAVLFYYFALYPYFNFEILRESIAICFFLLSIRHYVNKKWIYYYLIISISLMFHNSAIFLYFLPFFRNFKIRTGGLFAIFIVSALVNPVMPLVVNSSAIQYLVGSEALNYVGYNYTFLGLLFIFVTYLFVPLVAKWFAVDKLGFHLKYDVILSKGLLVASIIPLFFIFYRFFNYFSLIFILVVCEVIHYYVRKSKGRSSKVIVAIILFAISLIFYTNRYFSDTSEFIEGSNWYSHWYPYYSIFDPLVDQDRENLINAVRYQLDLSR